jgi:hypothetical protein
MAIGAKDIAIPPELADAFTGFIECHAYAFCLYFIRVSLLPTVLTLVGPKINATIGGV